MSGFASGNLILKTNLELIEQNMAPHSCLVDLDEKWLGYFTRRSDSGFFESVGGGSIELLPPSIREMSKDFPIINLVNMEDHGWSFCILQDNAIKSAFILSYEYEDVHSMAVATNEYGDFDALFGDKRNEILEKAENTINDYRSRLFDAVDFDAFRLFGVDDAEIAKLKNALCADAVEADRYKLVDVFFDALAISEKMEYLNYDKVNDYIDDHIVIAKK